jgi:hypothetical protein
VQLQRQQELASIKSYRENIELANHAASIMRAPNLPRAHSEVKPIERSYQNQTFAQRQRNKSLITNSFNEASAASMPTNTRNQSKTRQASLMQIKHANNSALDS